MKTICNNCQKKWDSKDLAMIDNIWERCDPGDEFPAGQCPDCGALCFIEKPTEYAHMFWTADDVKTLRPKWSMKKCEEVLSSVEGQLKDRIVERGWEVLENLL